MKIRVLFVCKGNICRSPSAEGIMQTYVNNAGLSQQIECDSAGIISFHAGENADPRMQKHANLRGYQLTSISRQITTEDFNNFNYIIVMDEENMHDLKRFMPNQYTAQIKQMTDFCTDTNPGFIPDPYYGGAKGFEQVLDLLENACANFLNEIKETHNL